MLANNVRVPLTRSRTERVPQDEQRLLADLQSLAGVLEVRPIPGGFGVMFPEADFVIRVSDHRAEQPCDTEWEVTVREPLPGLATWWGTWRRTFSVHRSEAAPLIAAEAQDAIARVRSMLDDRARSLSDA